MKIPSPLVGFIPVLMWANPPVDSMTLDQIFVNANKFEQDMIDVSNSVEIISEHKIENNSIIFMKDLSKLSSSITTIPQTTSTYTNITIRGINSADYYNPSMTLYVDEVPQSFNRLQSRAL